MTPKTRGLSDSQINRLIIRAKGDEALLRKQAIERAREKVLAILKRENVSLADIAPSLVPRRSLPAAAPKYQHPADPTLTWSGQGRPPRWFREQIDKGHDPSKLLVSAYAGNDVKKAVSKAKAVKNAIAKSAGKVKPKSAAKTSSRAAVSKKAGAKR
jgi:DNA-binding protein H-NS